MQEVFEKIDAILQKYRKKWLEQPNTEPCKGLECISNDCVDCMLTHLENDINQVAEEYVPDINVGDSWKIVYDKVLELEKEYAMSGDIENVNDCIRLENLLQYFKEELREENNQSLTNDGWIPCSRELPSDGEIHECTAQFNTGMRYIEYAYYDVAREEWWTHDDTGLVNVIAWQPLPEPYNPENVCDATSKKQTNADKIRNMTDEEWADLFDLNMRCEDCFLFGAKCGEHNYDCKATLLHWLQQEAEE